jgi:hypothetical protein
MQKERVLAAAAEWVFVPSDAEDYLEPDYRLTVYPDRTSVQWSSPQRPLPELIDEIRERARVADRPVLRWWVNDRTQPRNTAQMLESHGFTLAEPVEVLARHLTSPGDLTAALAVPTDVVVRPADDTAGFPGGSPGRPGTHSLELIR